MDVYSVSGCVCDDFTDYATFWKRNGYWLFDLPEDAIRLLEEGRFDHCEPGPFRIFAVYSLPSHPWGACVV